MMEYLVMNLFDQGIPRSDDGPSLYAEPQFRYLNRSSRQDVENVRVLLDSWFSKFPLDSQPNLRQRFRHDDSHVHEGAFFELFVYTLLQRSGWTVEVVECQPRVKTPDFKVHSPDGEAFFVEATVALGKSKEAESSERLVNQIYDSLNRVDSPNFFLGVKVVGSSLRLPGWKILKRETEAFLRKLDPDMPVPQSLSDFPRVFLPVEGGRIEISAFPKSPQQRTRAGVRPVAIPGMIRAEWADSGSSLKKAILSKATRYGEMDLPYIIAVNVDSWLCEMIDVGNALFGSEAYDASGRLFRLPNGVFRGPKGPINTRVSAVLVGCLIRPWTVGRNSARIFRNPWAKFPLAQSAFPGTESPSLEDDQLPKSNLIDPAIFGLPPDWPESTV